jgi:tyrosine-specific transport protein
VTGLLVAEVNINTLCEVGGGRGVSLSSMAQRTLGAGGARAVSAAYLLIHYSLLVACEWRLGCA